MIRDVTPKGNVELLAKATNFPCSGDQTTDCHAPDPAESCVVHFNAELLSVAAATCFGVVSDMILSAKAQTITNTILLTKRLCTIVLPCFLIVGIYTIP